MQQVRERSTAYLTVTCRDKTGQAQAPSALTYRIDDVFSAQAILPVTTVGTPSSTVELTLQPAHNRILDPARAVERRRVTVTATYGADDQVCDEYEYEVVNLGGVE